MSAITAATIIAGIGAAATAYGAISSASAAKKQGEQQQQALLQQQQKATEPPQSTAAQLPNEAAKRAAPPQAGVGGDPTALTGALGIPNDKLLLGKSTVLGS